jgi:tRNA1(Val) A37 N6-methylase TrmN6
MVVSRVIEIAPKNDIKTNRVLLELTKIDSTKRQERLIIREVDNSYTKQYRAYTKWFYLNF